MYLSFETSTHSIYSKKLIEKSRECHSHKPQPTLDTKRKRNWTEIFQTPLSSRMRILIENVHMYDNLQVA